MKVLIACEFSGVVREAFRKKGHDAWSCDLLPTEREGPHIQGDVLDILDDGWNLMIAHPPCTYMCTMSNCRIKEPGRLQKRKEGFDFFMKFIDAPIAKIAVENPRGYPERKYRRPDQIIQPYFFGHTASKATCLWLKNLPPLMLPLERNRERKWDGKRWRGWVDRKGNAKNRSITFQGIADAMAEQWG